MHKSVRALLSSFLLTYITRPLFFVFLMMTLLLMMVYLKKIVLSHYKEFHRFAFTFTIHVQFIFRKKYKTDKKNKNDDEQRMLINEKWIETMKNN